MGQLFLVDASAWIFALRRRPQQSILQRIDELLKQDLVATCGLIELELLGGAVNDAEFTRLQSRLRGLHRLAIQEDDWSAAARLAFLLRRAGITVPFTDVLLSALALRHDSVLVYADRDFDLISAHSALRIESLADKVG